MTDLRALDALIAEHVFGWKWSPAHAAWFEPIGEDEFHRKHFPRYSTDIALALGVLEKLREERGWQWSIARHPTIFETHIDPSPHDGRAKAGLQFSDRLPEAICRHVVHVLGLEVKP